MSKKNLRLTKIFMQFSGVIALAMCLLLGSFSLFLYHKDIMKKYYQIADTAVLLSADALNGDDVRMCIESGTMSSELKSAIRTMDNIKTDSEVAYLYVLYFPDRNQKDKMNYVLYANNEYDRSLGIPDSTINAPAGDEYAENMWEAFYDVQFGDGRGIRYVVNQYQGVGAHVPVITAIAPVYDSNDQVVCVIGADIFARAISAHTRSYLIGVALFGGIILLLGIWGYRSISTKYIINPISELAESAKDFVRKTQEVETPSELDFKVIDVKQDTEIRDLANELATMMGATKDYMVNLRNITAEKERIGAELGLATKIQADMLPRVFPAFPERKDFTVFASMEPAKEVGGDFYDFFFIDEDHFAMVMADVSGKGVPAALFMVIAKTLIKNTAQSNRSYSPSLILSEVNNQLCESNNEDLFVTVWLAIVDVKTGKGLAANAGHEHPVIRRAGGEFELMVYRHSMAVATMEGLRFKEHPFELMPGDTVFVYTDGIAEATDSNNELYGTDRMLAALNREKDANAERLVKNLREDIESFVKGAPQFDDITMMCFQYFGPEEE